MAYGRCVAAGDLRSSWPADLLCDFIGLQDLRDIETSGICLVVTILSKTVAATVAGSKMSEKLVRTA